ncbi:MAG: hypothetical protein ACKN9V_07335 [Pseudomonadota bacterium]
MKFRNCPNKECKFHTWSEGWTYAKKGYFKTKWNAQPVPRYRCRYCGKYFSSHTFRESYGQKKPYLNQEVFKWYASGTTLRRMAIVMGVSRVTINRKFLFMAELARKEHSRRIHAGELKTSLAHFDEMETFEHTKLKPLSIALAVRARTGEVIGAQIAEMNCKGHLAAISQMKYGWRKDNRNVAREDVLRSLNQCSRERLVVVTDKKTDYPKILKKCVPHAEIRQVKRVERLSTKVSVNRSNKYDALFTLNYTCAKIRHDLSRMARKVWVTTKKAERLQAHLNLYIAFNNGYKLAA